MGKPGSSKSTPTPDLDSHTPVNIVLVGRTGAGKSASGNTILGEKRFESKFSAKTITRECQIETAVVSGRRVTVLDTPGLYNTKRATQGIGDEIQKVKAFSRQGKCIFLLVIALDRFTEEEEKSVEKIQELFADEPLSKFMILFTNGDRLEGSIEEFLEEAGDELQGVMETFGHRYHVFNNKSTSNHKQVPELLEKIEVLMEEGNGNFEPMTKKPMRDRDVLMELQAFVDQIQLPSDEILSKEHVKNEDRAQETLRVVLLGRAGAGKSATGNTVLGRDAFQSMSALSSVTKQCRREEEKVCGRNVAVVDTPGFFDSKSSFEDVRKEIVRSVALSSPGPHAFILVISLKDRLSTEAIDTLKELHKRFGDDFKKYTIILFSHLDNLRPDQKLQDLIKSHGELCELLRPFKDRIHTFDNTNQGNCDQVRALIKKIDRMVKQNGGGCYTDEMYRMAEEAIPKEERRLHQAYGREMERKACELFQPKLLQAEAQRQEERGHGNGNGNDAGQEGEKQAWWQKIWAWFMSVIKYFLSKLFRTKSEDAFMDVARTNATGMTALGKCSPYAV